jgi:hypothetical protein
VGIGVARKTHFQRHHAASTLRPAAGTSLVAARCEAGSFEEIPEVPKDGSIPD